MKKYLIFLLVLVFAVSLGLAGTSCKAETTTTTAAGAETQETMAGETTAAELKPRQLRGQVLKFTDWQGGNEAILKSYNELEEIFKRSTRR